MNVYLNFCLAPNLLKKKKKPCGEEALPIHHMSGLIIIVVGSCATYWSLKKKSVL